MRISSPTFTSTLLALINSNVVNAQNNQSCSGQNNAFATPASSGSCMTGWSSGQTKTYPGDFQGILNSVTIYSCQTSGKRVIISNGIPDHNIVMTNNNEPCAINWAVEMPLNPVVASTKSEIPIRGMVAMGLNGVPAFGPQESEGTNAVETASGGEGFAGFWYGHASNNNSWHVHSPNMGEESITSTDLLGYAMDGFPIYGALSDTSGLDSCNGRYNNGSYQYHVRTLAQVDQSRGYCNGSSAETNWNYVLGCYSGSISGSSTNNSQTYTLPSDCVAETTPTPPGPSPAPPTANPPSAPSPTPPSNCSDNCDFKFGLDFVAAQKGCAWITRNKKKASTRKTRYCAKSDIATACPATCSSTCANDDSFTFELTWTKNTVNCTWITKNRKQAANRRTNYCGTVGASCISACGRCSAV